MVWLFGKHGHGARTVGSDGAPVCCGALEREGRTDGAAWAGAAVGPAVAVARGLRGLENIVKLERQKRINTY